MPDRLKFFLHSSNVKQKRNSMNNCNFSVADNLNISLEYFILWYKHEILHDGIY